MISLGRRASSRFMRDLVSGAMRLIIQRGCDEPWEGAFDVIKVTKVAGGRDGLGDRDTAAWGRVIVRNQMDWIACALATATANPSR